jgi:hypothetical protein
MANGKSIPLDFAQGVLQVRSALAQKAAEIRELKQRRITEQILEEERLRLQEQAMQLQAATAGSQIASHERIAQGNQEVEREAIAARLKVEERDRENRETGLINDFTAKLARGEAGWLDGRLRGRVNPEALQGPLVTEEGTGKAVPLYKVAELPSEDGSGSMFVPFSSKLLAAEYEKTMGQIKAQQELSATRAVSRKRTELNIERLESLKRGIPWLDPRERVAALEHGRKVKLSKAFELDLAGADPTKRAAVEAKYAATDDPLALLGYAVDDWQTQPGNDINAPIAPGSPPAVSQIRADTLSGGGTVTPEDPGRPFKGLYEEYGAYNPKTKAFRPLSSNVARRKLGDPGEGEVGAIRKFYINEKGGIDRERLESLQGLEIYDRLRSAGGPSQAGGPPPAQAQAAPQAAPPAPAPRNPLTPAEEQRARQLAEKLGSVGLTPQEQAEFDSFEARLEGR